MRNKRFYFALAILPAALAFAAWLAFRYGWVSDRILYLRANLGLLLLFVGLLLSIALGVGLWLYLYWEARARKSMSEVRNQASAQHRQFLQRLDHELKNPLTALQVELANVAEDSRGSTEQEADPTLLGGAPMERVREQIARLNDMVFQLRKLADLQSGAIEQTPVNLEELLNDLASEFSADKPNINLNLPRMPWPLPDVRGDTDLLYLALRNVLANAIKFSRAEDPIQIRAFEDSDSVIVEVADQGPGIPDEELPHVLEELYRGKNARGLPGSGLGLTLVHAIVERHGGQIKVRSRLTKGTVVALRLPRV